MGKSHFIGCANWSRGDGIDHRFTAIPDSVQVSYLIALFSGKAIAVPDTDCVVASCEEVVHPSHVPKDYICREFYLYPASYISPNSSVPARIHFDASGLREIGELSVRKCSAKLLILVSSMPGDRRAVVIPQSGVPHNHPLFQRSKVPFEAQSLYQSCIDSFGAVGASTSRVDHGLCIFIKLFLLVLILGLGYEPAPSTRAILKGKTPQNVHPSLINNRKRRRMVHDAKQAKLPLGTSFLGWSIFAFEYGIY